MIEWLFDEGGVANPDNYAGGVAVANFADQQIGAGLIQRFGKFDGDTPIPVSIIRVQLQIPIRHLLADVFGLVFMDQAPADIVDPDSVAVQAPGIGPEIGFYITKQPVDPDTVGLKIDFRTIAISILDRWHAAGRLGADGFKNAPVIGDLVHVPARLG